MGDGKGKDGRLAIPLGELDGFGGRLRSIKTRMDGTKKMFEDYRDDIGDGGVVDKLEEFESGWEDGREDIGQQLTSLSEMADTVVREIKKLDLDLQKKLKDGMKEKSDTIGNNKGGHVKVGGEEGKKDGGKGGQEAKK